MNRVKIYEVTQAAGRIGEYVRQYRRAKGLDQDQVTAIHSDPHADMAVLSPADLETVARGVDALVYRNQQLAAELRAIKAQISDLAARPFPEDNYRPGKQLPQVITWGPTRVREYLEKSQRREHGGRNRLLIVELDPGQMAWRPETNKVVKGPAQVRYVLHANEEISSDVLPPGYYPGASAPIENEEG
jgi:hypothetical protein